MTAREPLWASGSHPNRDHIWWHKALYHLDLGQYEAALAIYDGPFLAAEKAWQSVSRMPRRCCGAWTRWGRMSRTGDGRC